MSVSLMSETEPSWWNDYSSSRSPSFCPAALLSDEGRADVCGRKASHFFSLAESLRSPKADPFTWVFIRPPWSPTGSCCKAVVFDRLRAECDNDMVGSAAAEISVYVAAAWGNLKTKWKT